MTNIKYLKENNLYEAHEHFMRLSEAYIPTFPEEELEEAGDEQDPMGGGAPGADPMAGGDPNAMGGAPGADPMAGGDPNAMGGDPGMGGDPNAMGGDPGMGGDPNAMSGDPNADPMGGGADPMMGDDPMAGGPDDMGGEDPLADSEPEDDGDTIDIDGLTHAEDKLNVKQNQIGRDLSKVDSRITSLIDTIGKLQTALDSNNSELEALKAEFEKRNPTQTEKLNLRSLDSYPFNVKPTDYWADKAAQGGYEAISDNDKPTTQEYVITNDDVDNPAKDIADTFFKIDDDDIQTLDKLFGL
jgi:hypothetical protein